MRRPRLAPTVRLNKFLFVAAVWAGVAGPATAFPLEDDDTPGTRAVGFERRTNLWGRFDSGFVDAKITSSPPDEAKLDRRLETYMDAGFDLAFDKKYGLRFDAKATISKRKEAEVDEPRAVVEKTIKSYTPSLDATYVTDKGLEIFAGVEYEVEPAYEETVDSALASSKTDFGKSALLSRRVGVVRRAGPWTGGFYYELGAEGSRSFKKTATDGSKLEGSEKTFIPSKLGVVGDFGALGSLWNFELDFIQARGLGPADEKGSTLYTDYFEARGGFRRDVSGPFGVEIDLAHKTLSYATNASMTLETMPASSVKILLTIGGKESRIFMGLLGTYGTDEQSLPEFNAKYEMKAVAATGGCRFPL